MGVDNVPALALDPGPQALDRRRSQRLAGAGERRVEQRHRRLDPAGELVAAAGLERPAARSLVLPGRARRRAGAGGRLQLVAAPAPSPRRPARAAGDVLVRRGRAAARCQTRRASPARRPALTARHGPRAAAPASPRGRRPSEPGDGRTPAAPSASVTSPAASSARRRPMHERGASSGWAVASSSAAWRTSAESAASRRVPGVRQPPADGKRLGQRLAAGALGRRELGGELDQPERRACGGGHQAVGDGRCDPVRRGPQERAPPARRPRRARAPGRARAPAAPPPRVGP